MENMFLKQLVLTALSLANYAQSMQNFCPEVVSAWDVSPEMLTGRWYEIKRTYFPPQKRQLCSEFHFSNYKESEKGRTNFSTIS